MLLSYHRAITQEALQDVFSPQALEAVITANLGQDHWLRGQIGHDEYHFDQNAFRKSLEYMESNRSLIRPALESEDIPSAQKAFGRLTHAGQDFYAHSNYVSLWLGRLPEGKWPPPVEIEPLDQELVASPRLRSGRLYYPLEVLSFIPVLKKSVLPLLPRDSHAWMNLDSPERGPLFEYAFAAAVKRTRYEYSRTTEGLNRDLLERFRN
jgi:hypothetical protein